VARGELAVLSDEDEAEDDEQSAGEQNGGSEKRQASHRMSF
jgi:hypothetical protein